MTVVLWRIGVDTPEYEAHDLTGKGAEKDGGRWNRPGSSVVYTSTTIALSCLETVVHLNADDGLPLNRFLVRIDVPDATWAARITLAATDLPVGWDSIPHGKVSLDAGDNWLRNGTSALLLVPSVVVPEEFNVLINPTHADSADIASVKVRRWLRQPSDLK